MAQQVKILRGFFSAFFSVNMSVWSGFLAGACFVVSPCQYVNCICVYICTYIPYLYIRMYVFCVQDLAFMFLFC